MKKQILDIPFQDSFEDFLEKGETILWTKTLEENIQIPLILNDEGRISFHLKQIRWFFILINVLAIILLFLPHEGVGLNWFSAMLPYLFGIISIPREWTIYGKRIHQTMYGVTQKRILFRLAHLPKNEIHDIPFSQIRDFIPLQDGQNIMSFILVVKNPQSIPFDTGHHQPTLVDIKNVEQLTQLIRQGIRNNS